MPERKQKMPTWREDGRLLTDSGDVGGDEQMSPAFSRRFACTENPAIVTVYTYVVRSEQDIKNDEWNVEEQIEYLVGEDPNCPADTEIWSEYIYERGSIDGRALKSEAEAYEDASRRILLWGPEIITWDGEPFQPDGEPFPSDYR